MRLTVWTRNLIYLGILCVCTPWLIVRRLRTGRYRKGLRSKLFGTVLPASHASPARPTIWMHGVSVGEVQLLAALIESLQHELPNVRCCLSTTTDSGMQLANKLLPAHERLYMPLDFSWAVDRTLESIRPDLLILGELELWPNLIDATQRRGIPMMVVNGRLSEKSFEGYQQNPLIRNCLSRPMFGKLSQVAAQNETYAERFRACGCEPSRVRVTGNLKFDNVSLDPAQ